MKTEKRKLSGWEREKRKLSGWETIRFYDWLNSNKQIYF